MIAIETRYVGPTNTKGSRIIASTVNGQRLTMSTGMMTGSDYDNHKEVAEALATKYRWLYDGTRLVGGGTKAGYCWVFVYDNNAAYQRNTES
jgi:hypothetical protein